MLLPKELAGGDPLVRILLSDPHGNIHIRCYDIQAEMYVMLRSYDIQAEMTQEIWTCGGAREGLEVHVYICAGIASDRENRQATQSMNSISRS